MCLTLVIFTSRCACRLTCATRTETPSGFFQAFFMLLHAMAALVRAAVALSMRHAAGHL